MQKPVGIILSGGRGIRMDGVDKGLQLYRNRPLISWVIDAIKPQTNHLIISINRNLKEYEKFGDEIVFDDSNTQWQGPIAGILTVAKQIKNSSYSQLLVCPCDSPSVPTNYAERLQLGLSNGDYEIAVVHDGKRTQNLHCLINCSAIQSLEKFYTDGGRSMQTWLKESKTIEIDFSIQASLFKNINMLKDLS